MPSKQTSESQISPATLGEDEMWRAAEAKDPAFEDAFIICVKTTKIYCRPTCPARTPFRRNVSFAASAVDAEAAGFRACKRCRPNVASDRPKHAEAVTQACRAIESAEEAPSLAALAAKAGMSPYHFHRVFKQIAGVTPKAYAAEVKANGARSGLARGQSVTATIYDAGFGSNARFYDASPAMFGMKPAAFRAGGKGEDIKFAVGQCSLGAILVGATEKGVCAIEFGDDPNALLDAFQRRFSKAHLVGGDAIFERLVADVVGYVESRHEACALPLDVRGTAFQRRVWDALRAIPPGKTASYAEIASKIGAPKSSRAVARACASNAIAVAVPCHRVIRANGDLSGYRWGIARKSALLERETKAV